MSALRQNRAATKRASIPEPCYTYVPDYLNGTQAQKLLGWLLANADWRSERLKLFGRTVVVPRLVAWFGEPGVCYRYSNTGHTAAGWPPRLDALVAMIRAEFAPDMNFLLVNRYRNGADSMGWHTDDEPEIAGRVVSISLGAARTLHLRGATDRSANKLDLGHGALLIHGRDCPHALPKTRRPVGERINLSFRTVMPR